MQAVLHQIGYVYWFENIYSISVIEILVKYHIIYNTFCQQPVK